MLFNVEHLTHIGQGIIGEFLTIVRKKDFRHAMFKYKFLEDSISYSCGLLVRYGFWNGPPQEDDHPLPVYPCYGSGR